MAAAEAAEQVREAAWRPGVEQRRAASGRAAAGGRGGWLQYCPIEDAPLHGLHGGTARANPVRREAGPGGLARGGSEQRAAHGRKE